MGAKEGASAIVPPIYLLLNFVHLCYILCINTHLTVSKVSRCIHAWVLHQLYTSQGVTNYLVDDLQIHMQTASVCCTNYHYKHLEKCS